jgi:DNA-binding MarR family transcriptional regulator
MQMNSKRDAPVFKQDFNVGYLLARLGAQAHAAWAKMLESHNLAPSQFIMLDIISALGPVHQQPVADAMGIDARNAVSLVDKLEDAGLVERIRDKVDRRKQILTVTSKGRTLVGKIKIVEKKLGDDFFVSLSAEQCETLRSLLHRLHIARGG